MDHDSALPVRIGVFPADLFFYEYVPHAAFALDGNYPIKKPGQCLNFPGIYGFIRSSWHHRMRKNDTS